MVCKVQLYLDKYVYKGYNVLTMVNPFGSPRKPLVIGATIAVVGAFGAAVALNSPQSTGADTSPLTQEVDRQGQQLSNHEARITNTESDVKDLQNKTDTPPSVTRVYVPGANTTQTVTSTPNTPAPGPTPPVVTTTAVQQLPNGENIDCKLNYSDGTSIVRKWYVVDKHTEVVKVEHYEGLCDSTLIGQAK